MHKSVKNLDKMRSEGSSERPPVHKQPNKHDSQKMSSNLTRNSNSQLNRIKHYASSKTCTYVKDDVNNGLESHLESAYELLDNSESPEEPKNKSLIKEKYRPSSHSRNDRIADHHNTGKFLMQPQNILANNPEYARFDNQKILNAISNTASLMKNSGSSSNVALQDKYIVHRREESLK